MIQSFACEDTQAWYEDGKAPRKWQEIAKVAPRKLDMVDAAVKLEDLRFPPGNRLEALSGDRKGRHSIRINDKWRICFKWGDAGPEDVEIVDYH